MVTIRANQTKTKCPSKAAPVKLEIKREKTYFESMKAAIFKKGQVTVPKACRDRLGLTPGTVLDFEVADGKLVGVKRKPDDVVRKWRGKGRLPSGLGVDAYLTRVRG